MRWSFVLVCVLCVFSVNNVKGKVFETRCKLVKELIRVGLASDIFLGQWVCLIEKESKRNTSAYYDGSRAKKYGLYQIPNEWCRVGKKGGDCNIKCEALLDDDIVDDTKCAVKIFNEKGFQYWPQWMKLCKNNNFITQEIYKCPDLIFGPSVMAEQRSETLRRRRKLTRSAAQRYIGTVP